MTQHTITTIQQSTQVNQEKVDAKQFKIVTHFPLKTTVYLFISIEPLSLKLTSFDFENILRSLTRGFLGVVGSGMASFDILHYRDTIQCGILKTNPLMAPALRTAFSLGSVTEGRNFRVTTRSSSSTLLGLSHKLKLFEKLNNTLALY